MTYRLLCPCGRALGGPRQQRHQVVPCPGCGRPHFVFPRSAYAGAGEPAARARPRWWLPAAAGAGCVLLLLVGFLAALPWLGRPRQPDAPADARGQMEAGRRLLGQGKFRQARETLAAALNEKAGLSPAEQRDLRQLHRQADLLSRLLVVDLDEVLRQARLARDGEEWRRQFDDEFRGRAVLFDGVVRRDRDGRPVLADFVVESGDDKAGFERARLALEDVEALKGWPFEDGSRLVFGARLRGCEREPGGGWAVRFEPDGGVLMTDDAALGAADTTPPDEGLRAALARQRQWLDEGAK